MAPAPDVRSRTARAPKETSGNSRRRSAAPSAGSRAARPATRPSRSESAGPPPRVRKTTRSSTLAPVVVQRRDINGIEAFADPEQEDADADEGDQNQEGDADCDLHA